MQPTYDLLQDAVEHDFIVTHKSNKSEVTVVELSDWDILHCLK